MMTLAGDEGPVFSHAMDDMPNLIPRQPPSAAAAKKSTKRTVLAMLLGGGIGAVAGFFGVRYGLDLMLPIPGSKLLKLVPIATLPLSWLVVVGFHELGHVIGGWLVGGKFLLWVVGPLMVRRTPAGIRLGLNRNINVAGGMGACLPLEPERMTPRRAAVMILGGPVASLVLMVGLLWLAVALAAGNAPVTAALALTQNGVMFTAGLSFMIFLVTAAPSATGGFKSDGKRVYELMRGGRRSEQDAALLMLTTAGLAGIRPADYDPGLIAKVLSLGDRTLFDLYGHLTAYYWAADRGDWPAAQGHLDYVLAGEDQVVPYVRDVLRCEYAWLLATRTADVAAARAWLAVAGQLEFDPATRLRAEAAVLLAEGKPAEAATKARAGLHALEHKSLSPVQSPFVLDALEALLRRAGA